jgi:hypothetical protein
MPDAGASRKRQISGQRIPSDLTTPAEPASPEVEAEASGPLILIRDGRSGGADQAMLPLGFFATADWAGLKTGSRHTGIGLFPA